MGRWGTGNFESDSSLDHRAIMLIGVVKDIVFGLAPHNHHAFRYRYALQILGAVDLLVRTCEHYNAFIEIPSKSVREWAEAYLKLFDYAWNHPPDRDYLDNHHFPELKRQDIVAAFARLEAIARRVDDLWDKQAEIPEEEMELQPGPEIFETAPDESYLWHFMRRLANDISLRLATENLYAFGQELEELRADADMLVCLAAAYKTSVGRNVCVVRYWRDTTLNHFDTLGATFSSTDENDDNFWSEERRIIVETFDKLEKLAEKYPEPSYLDGYGREDNA